MSALRYTKKNGSLSVHFAARRRDLMSWKEEIFAAAKDVALRTRKPIWVCSSGGIDSEIACRAFLEQKIPFKVLTLAHEGGTNQHDIHYAIKWCKEHNVEQKVVSVDVIDFLTRQVYEYAERYVAVHPFRFFQIKLMEIVEAMNGYAVLCSGEQLYLADPTKPQWKRGDMYLSITNGNIVPLQWCEDNNTAHEPYFHFATPELCLAYLRQPLVSFALDNPDLIFRHPTNRYTFKRLVYQAAWPDIEVRYKYDGYEQIKPLLQETLKRLHLRFEDKFIEFDPTIPELERQLEGV